MDLAFILVLRGCIGRCARKFSLRQMPATTTSIKVTLQSLNISSAVISCDKIWYELIYAYIHLHTQYVYVTCVYIYTYICVYDYICAYASTPRKNMNISQALRTPAPHHWFLVFSMARRADGCLHGIEVWLHQRQRHSTGPWEYASRSQDGSTPGRAWESMGLSWVWHGLTGTKNPLSSWADRLKNCLLFIVSRDSYKY